MILPGHEIPRNGVDPEEMNMRWCLSTPGSPKYGLPVAQSTSISPVSLYTRNPSLTMYLEALIERVKRCTWRPRLCELRDALGGKDRVNSEIHCEALIEQVWRCTWRPRLSELRDALGGRDTARLELNWEAVIEWVWRRNWRPRLSELRDAIGNQDWVNSEMHWEAGIEWVWRCTYRLWSSGIREVLRRGRFGGRWDGSLVSIHWLTCNCGNVETWIQQHPPRDGKLVGSRILDCSGRLLILGWCCTWCMLYSVLSHDHGMER